MCEHYEHVQRAWRSMAIAVFRIPLNPTHPPTGDLLQISGTSSRDLLAQSSSLRNHDGRSIGGAGGQNHV